MRQPVENDIAKVKVVGSIPTRRKAFSFFSLPPAAAALQLVWRLQHQLQLQLQLQPVAWPPSISRVCAYLHRAVRVLL